jgi:hypothetical protein
MFGKMINRLNQALAPRPQQTMEEVESLLSNRSSAEIAARLLDRARMIAGTQMERYGALDRVAAEKIRGLEQERGTNMREWQERCNRCLCLLQEGKN